MTRGDSEKQKYIGVWKKEKYCKLNDKKKVSKKEDEWVMGSSEMQHRQKVTHSIRKEKIQNSWQWTQDVSQK